MSLQTTQDVYKRVINEVVRELKEDSSMKTILTSAALDYLKKTWLKKLEESGVWAFDNSLSQQYMSYHHPPMNQNFFGSHCSTSILDDIFMIPAPNKNFITLPQSSHNEAEQRKPDLQSSLNNQENEAHIEKNGEEAARQDNLSDKRNNSVKESSDANTKNHADLNLHAENSKKEHTEPHLNELEAKKNRDDSKKSEEMQILQRKQSDQLDLPRRSTSEHKESTDLAAFFEDEEAEEVKKQDDHAVKHLVDKQTHEKLAKERQMKREKEESDPGELLNSGDDTDEPAIIGDSGDNFIDGFFERKTISDTKWKVSLFHGILRFEKKEYILSPIRGDFTFAKKFLP